MVFKSNLGISLTLFYTYNDTGQLACILCQSVVKSDAIWPVHINSKQHRDNVEKAKKLKEKTNNFTTPLKRPLTPPHEVPAKKPKSILKNGTSQREEEAEDAVEAESSNANSKGVPDDFFDSAKIQPPKLLKSSSSKEEKMETEEVDDHTLPEGFFDDPKLDAKVQLLFSYDMFTTVLKHKMMKNVFLFCFNFF